MPAAMPCKTPIFKGVGKQTAVVGKTRQNMLVLSKRTSPRELDWKEFLVSIMRIVLQRKEQVARAQAPTKSGRSEERRVLVEVFEGGSCGGLLLRWAVKGGCGGRLSREVVEGVC